MIDLQLVQRGIDDRRVLDAFRAVPRELFLPEELRELAYQDSPLPIGEQQNISQPYIVALTLQALSLCGDETVLEIGTGSGYQTALLSHLARRVFTVERLAGLADQARQTLAQLGLAHIEVLCGDGTLGWPAHAPYDAIAVAAGGPQIPERLLSQLAPRGRMVIPVGSTRSEQRLTRITREEGSRYRREALAEVRFVPLIGAQGWDAPAEEEGDL